MTTRAATDLLFWLGIGLGAVGFTAIISLMVLNVFCPLPADEFVPDVFPAEWADREEVA